MHAPCRRIEVKTGRAAEVAALIEAEYLPLIDGSAGYVSYTLVGLGDDEVAAWACSPIGPRPTGRAGSVLWVG